VSIWWPRGALGALTWSVLALAAPFLLADPAGPQRLAVLSVAVLAAAVAGSLAAGVSFAHAIAGVPLVSHVTALRVKSWHVAFLRLRDPDAPGRARPRAPGAGPAAA
jgi:hypothetical protein